VPVASVKMYVPN